MHKMSSYIYLLGSGLLGLYHALVWFSCVLHRVLTLCLYTVNSELKKQSVQQKIMALWFWYQMCDFFIGLQEAHKLLQPADKILKEMAIEFAEYQVVFLLIIFPILYELRSYSRY